MSNDLMIVFGLAFILFLIQAFGGYIQINGYRQAVKRLQQLGYVGVGQKKAFMQGSVVLIACDNKGNITGAEAMEGLSILARFKPKTTLWGEELIGSNIYTFWESYQTFDKKQKKRHKGYIQAFDDLYARLGRVSN